MISLHINAVPSAAGLATGLAVTPKLKRCQKEGGEEIEAANADTFSLRGLMFVLAKANRLHALYWWWWWWWGWWGGEDDFG